MCICTLKHSLICVECRAFISVPLGASIKWAWYELKGNFLLPFGTGSKSATKICTSSQTYTRPWAGPRDPSAFLLSMALLLYFLSACHSYNTQETNSFCSQQRPPNVFFTSSEEHRAWHCYKAVPQACLPCRDSALKGGSVPSRTAFGKVSQSHLPSALWGAWCANKPTSIRLGADGFLQL